MSPAGEAEVGIRAVGAYAPRLRIKAEEFEAAWGRFEAAGIEEKAVPEADEDALTMACEAARRALAAAEVDGQGVEFLAFASTTPPLAEEDLTARLGSMLGVPGDATRHEFTASTRAGTRALIAGLEAAPAPGVIVAADCPHGQSDDAREHAAGAGAVAFVLGPDAPVTVEARAEYSEAYPGTRFRETGEERLDGIDVTTYDRMAFTEPISEAVNALDGAARDSTDVVAVALQAPNGELPYRAAGVIGITNDAVKTCATVHELGDTGAASVPLSVASALAGGRTTEGDRPATDGRDSVLAVAWGSGSGADALSLLVTGEVPVNLALDAGEYLTYAEYLRRRGEITGGDPAGGGAYVPVPTWKRSLPQRHRLIAGRCLECDTLAFPPEGACPDCGALGEFELVELPGEGTVDARTRISRGGAPPEFAEQQARSGAFDVAIVSFDGPGGSISAPAQVIPGSEVEVGDHVAAVIRRVYTQEGVTRYGFKVRPTE